MVSDKIFLIRYGQSEKNISFKIKCPSDVERTVSTETDRPEQTVQAQIRSDDATHNT